MRSTAPLSTGMQIPIPLSGASAADTGRLALPESPCCRGRHDFPDEPFSGVPVGGHAFNDGVLPAQGHRNLDRLTRGGLADVDLFLEDEALLDDEDLLQDRDD